MSKANSSDPKSLNGKFSPHLIETSFTRKIATLAMRVIEASNNEAVIPLIEAGVWTLETIIEMGPDFSRRVAEEQAPLLLDNFRLFQKNNSSRKDYSDDRETGHKRKRNP